MTKANGYHNQTYCPLMINSIHCPIMSYVNNVIWHVISCHLAWHVTLNDIIWYKQLVQRCLKRFHIHTQFYFHNVSYCLIWCVIWHDRTLQIMSYQFKLHVLLIQTCPLANWGSIICIYISCHICLHVQLVQTWPKWVHQSYPRPIVDQSASIHWLQ